MRAINHVRLLGGGQSEPHLFTCDDGQDWVLKLPNNPQGSQLGNDYLGSLLARQFQLPVPEPAVVDVDQAALAGMDVVPSWAVPGAALGSLYLRSAAGFSPNATALAADAELAARLLVFDSWIETLDRRRPDGAWNLLVRTDSTNPAIVVLDFGFALNAGVTLGRASILPDSYPVEIINATTAEAVAGMMGELGSLDEGDITSAIERVPREWMNSSVKRSTLSFLLQRRTRIMSGELLTDLGWS